MGLEEAQIYEEGLPISQCELHSQAHLRFACFLICLSPCVNETVHHVPPQLCSQYKVSLGLCVCWVTFKKDAKLLARKVASVSLVPPTTLTVLGVAVSQHKHRGESRFSHSSSSQG